jgi:hypothetical protein
LYFNFFQFFSLWLTCRAKQFSSADVEGTDGDNKGAHGDAKGVQKMPKKPEKVQKKRHKQISGAICSCQKSCCLPYAKGAKKRQKRRHKNTKQKYIYICVTIRNPGFSVSCITDFKFMGRDGVFDK